MRPVEVAKKGMQAGHSPPYLRDRKELLFYKNRLLKFGDSVGVFFKSGGAPCPHSASFPHPYPHFISPPRHQFEIVARHLQFHLHPGSRGNPTHGGDSIHGE